MQIPSSPESDTEIDRHKFYGAISTALECLKDRIDNDDEKIHENHTGLHNKYHAINKTLEDLHVRINRRVYVDDYNHLKTQVHQLAQHEVAHRTAWATGKTFIFASWIVFSVLFGWGYSLSQKTMESYLETITVNEQLIIKLEHSMKLVDLQLIENLVFHKEKAQALKELKKQHDYFDDTIKNHYANLNTLNNSMKQINDKIDGFHVKKK